MTDLVNTARTARERLAVGLNALQNPELPEQLQAAAEPIAQAMSSLLQIERTGSLSLGKGGPTVLDLVRLALARLQSQTLEHPALFQAMEAVAGSLGTVYGLVQRVSSAPPPAPTNTSSSPQRVVASPAVAAAPRVAPMQPVAAQPQKAVTTSQLAPSVPRPGAVADIPRPQRSTPVEGGKLQPSAGVSTLASRQAANAALPNAIAAAMKMAPGADGSIATAQTMVAGDAMLQAPMASAPTPLEIPAAAKLASSPPPAVATAAGTPPAPGLALQRVAAELGAHSATNFYKGLSGNDVVDSGGIFIATYQVPPIGRNLLIRVSLPGGYEFEAKGIVRWTREASSSGSDSVSPGFGAQFTEISPEARQLVYRYARNREPLFHDDL